ncbi:MAG: phosphoribosylglycinamide formyltransferase-1 [Bacteroidia bacterium]|jgi:phosphoribosylglycinamide formyltransferase-1
MIRLGIFASGSGTNAININNYFADHEAIEVTKIYCNNPVAGIITKAFSNDIPLHVFTKRQLNSGSVLNQLKQDRIDVIVLAGFLWLIPQDLTLAFPNKIINIHPALLPAYGGKGMYGSNVHKAIIDNKEPESGITIHLVDNEYDTGDLLYQAKTAIDANESPDSLAQKIHILEHQHFPVVIEKYVLEL